MQRVQNQGYSATSAINIITGECFGFFKDLNKNGSVDKYEDGRLEVNERASHNEKATTLNKFRS